MKLPQSLRSKNPVLTVVYLALALGGCASSGELQQDSGDLSLEPEAQTEDFKRISPALEDSPPPMVAKPSPTPAPTPSAAPLETAQKQETPAPAEVPHGQPTETQPAVASTEPAALMESNPQPKPINTSSVRARSGRDHSIPYYLQKRPTLALQISGLLKSALGSESTVGSSSLDAARAAELQGDYQPAWIQTIGVVSLGIHVRHHQTSAAPRITGYGGQIAYQAKWFTNQWIVPVAGYQLDQVNYRLSGGQTGTLSAPASFYGLRFFLSAADPDAAAEFYTGYDVSRVYLTVEMTDRNANDANLALSGKSTSFGLRFEF